MFSSFTIRSFSKHVPRHWNERLVRKNFFEKLGKTLELNHWTDWYQVTTNDVIKHGGSGLLSDWYGNSLSRALVSLFPEYDWKNWKFRQVPSHFWDSRQNQKDFMDDLGKQLGISNLEEWNNISTSTISDNGGSSLLQKYDKKKNSLLQSIYPEHSWNFPSTKITTEPNSEIRLQSNTTDHSIKNKEILDNIKKHLKIKDIKDWKKLTESDLIKHGGFELLRDCNYSLSAVMTMTFPERKSFWSSIFKYNPGFWKNVENQREYLNYVGREFLGVKKISDWYNVNPSELNKHGVRNLLKNYNDSFHRAITEIYKKDLDWKIWRFKIVPNGYWTNQRNIIDFLEDIYKELEFTNMNDWYNLTTSEFESLGGSTLLSKYGGLYNILTKCYPDHKLEYVKFNTMKKSQHVLFRKISNLIHNKEKSTNVDVNVDGIYKADEVVDDEDVGEDVDVDGDILVNYIHPTLKEENSGKNLSFDFYLPKYSVAIDYQNRNDHLLYNFGHTNIMSEIILRKRIQCKKMELI